MWKVVWKRCAIIWGDQPNKGLSCSIPSCHDPLWHTYGRVPKHASHQLLWLFHLFLIDWTTYQDDNVLGLKKVLDLMASAHFINEQTKLDQKSLIPIPMSGRIALESRSTQEFRAFSSILHA